MPHSRDISIPWSDELRTGNDLVDTQHQRLIELFNRLAVMRAGDIERDVVVPILSELLDYSRYHFDDEAGQMRRWCVDQVHQRAHLAAHKSFVTFLQRTAAMLDDNVVDGVDNLVLFLSQWLLHHIMGMDVRMTREIRLQQAGGAAQTNAIRDEMTHVVSDLYNQIGARNFDVHALNVQLKREIVARRHSEDALLKVDQLLRALIRASDMLLASHDERQAMQVMCEQLLDTNLFSGGCILQPAVSGQATLLAFAGASATVACCSALLEGGATRHSIEQAWRESSMLCVNEAEWLDDSLRCTEKFTSAGLRSWAAIPIDREGAPFAVWMVASPLPDCFDAEIILLMMQAGSLLKRALGQIELKHTLAREREQQGRLARHDALTGLTNRLGMLEHLPKALARAARSGSTMALGLIDLDDFKPVNDTWGHAAGDRVLVEFARRLQSLLRAPDLIARLGGDEFVVVLEDIDEREDSQQLSAALQRLHQVVDSPFELAPGVVASLGMSMGLAIFPQHGTEAEGLIRQADAALYHAKAAKHERANWWSQVVPGSTSYLEIAPSPRLDPYGLAAIDLLQKASETIELVADQFVPALYQSLAETAQAMAILDHLDPAERQALHIRQAEHLRFLLGASSTQEAILQRAAHLGKVHALVNVKSSLLIQTSRLYRTLFFNQLDRTTLRPRERAALQSLITTRLEDDTRAQLQAQEAVQESYLTCLTAEMPAGDTRWMDAIEKEMAVLNCLPGVKAVVLMRLDGSGVFVVETFAGDIGKQAAAILSDPATCATADASVPRGQGLTAQAWRSGRILTSASYQQDKRYTAWHALVAPLRIRSTMAVPVLDPQGHPVAVLGFYGAYPNQFGSDWMSSFAHGIQRRWSQTWQVCHSAPSVVLPPDVVQSYRTRLFDGGLVLHMQPIVDLCSGKVVKVEALARLQSDPARLIYPDEFIPLLGEVELARLFQFGLQQLLQHLAHWHRSGLMIGASINLSPSTFHAPGTPALIAEALSRHGIAPRYLSLELLESGGLDDLAQREAFERIAGLGVSIEMDDLGSGFSSLQRLSALPFATTKVDRSLVSGLRKEPLQTFSLLAALIALGRDIHRPVVLEGLEEPSMIEVASVLGATYGQGYAFAQPMPAEAILAWAGAFSLPAAPRPLRTALGALAYLWKTNRSFPGQWQRPVADCPLAQFLDLGGVAAAEGREGYASMRDGGGATDGGSRRLQEWLLRHALSAA